MSQRRNSSPGARRRLDRLAALRSDAGRQASFAAEIVADDSAGIEELTAALPVLAAHPRHEAREAIAARLDVLLLAGRKRDAGGFVRAALCRALTPVALAEDAARFAAACLVYEPTAFDRGAPAVLRAAGVAALSAAEPGLAAVHAVRLLGEADPMSGEPALTAANVLAAIDEMLPLYQLLLGGGHEAPEVTAAAMRGVASLPPGLLLELARSFADARDTTVQLGLCDLYLDARAAPTLASEAEAFLRQPPGGEIYRYLVAGVVASRQAALGSALARAAMDELDPARLAVLAELLPLGPVTEDTRAALAQVGKRLAGRRKA